MADEQEIRAQMNGLVTEPSRIIAGDAGLIELENAMCRSPGLIEPRGGLRCVLQPNPITDLMYTTTYVREWTALGTSRQWFAATDGTNTRMYENGAGASVIQVAGDEDALRAEPFADRQIWTFKKALRMLDASTPASASFDRLPGAPRGPAFMAQPVNAAAATRLLSPNYGTAYRVCIARYIATDLGERVVYGAPSDRVVFWNQTLAGVNSCDVKLTIETSLLAANDEIQIYRAPLVVGPIAVPTTLDPGDELQLIHSYRLTGAVSRYTWTDTAADLTWSGAPLYTNNTQDGLLAANYRPRMATDVAYYNGMAFYAQASRGQSKTIELRSVTYNSGVGGSLAPENTLASLLFACDTTIGTANLTNCNPTVTVLLTQGLCVGQLVNVAAKDPDDTTGTIWGQVQSWNAGTNTIVVGGVAAATTVATACVLWDWVGIATGNASTIKRIYAFPMGQTTRTWGDDSGVFCSDNGVNAATILQSQGAFDMERAWLFKYQSANSDSVIPRLYVTSPSAYPYGRGITLRFEYDDDASAPGDSKFTVPFEVISSKVFAFSRMVGQTFSANICRSENDGGPARLGWSKLLQPEAYPLLQYQDIGDISKAIVRIVATTDRVYILKADGLWCAYGSTPGDIIIQQVDPTCRMASLLSSAGVETIHSSQWVRKLGNTVYAWTLKGIVAIDASGVRSIDDAIGSEIRAVSPTSDAINNPVRPFSSASLRDDLVAFGRAGGGGVDAFIYVYNAEQQTWAKWSTDLTVAIANLATNSALTGSGDSDAGTMWFGCGSGVAYYSVRYPEGESASYGTGLPYQFADALEGTPAAARLVFNVDSVAGATGEYTDANATLAEGCIVTQGGVEYMVLTADGAAFRVDRSGLVVGPATISYYPIPQTITYASTTNGAPSVDKFFSRAFFGFQRLRGGTRFKDRYLLRGQSPADSTTLTEQYPLHTAVTDLSSAIGRTEDRDFELYRAIPTSHSRGTGIQVSLLFRQAAVYQAIDSLSVTFQPKSTTIGRRS